MPLFVCVQVSGEASRHTKSDGRSPRLLGLSQVLLNEPWAEMNVNLNQGRIANAFETMDLASLDDKDIASAALKALTVHHP